MVINLLHEQPLNAYLTDIVYQGENIPKQQSYSGEFESPDYVEQHSDEIVKGILFQYMKSRIRNHLILMDKEPAFVKVDKNRTDLPGWTEAIFARGENIYEFDGSKISQKLRDEITIIRDFLYDEALQYVNKVIRIARETKKKPKIRYDYLKTTNEYDTFEKTLVAAKHWHDNIAAELSKRNKARDLLEKSLKGARHIADLQDGLSVYQLTTEEALDFESEYMGHCVGKGSYDKGVKDGKIQIYSMRDEYGEPHVTFEVRDGKVLQCKGKANKRPIKKYVPAIQEFVKRQNFKITPNDSINMGLLKAGKNFYNIYDLPKELVVDGDLVISSGWDLGELPDFSGWTVKGNFMCHDETIKNLKGAPKRVEGNFDCYSFSITSLEGCPEYIGGDFGCSHNQLTSLKGGPKYVGGNFGCSDNQLTSLEGAPEHVGGNFDCSNNQLTSLKGSPERIEKNFNCSNNQLSSLIYAPKYVGGSFMCSGNKLINLKGAPERVEEVFVCSCNPLISLEGLPKYVGYEVEIGQKDGSLPFMAPEYIMGMNFVDFESEMALTTKAKQQMIDNWNGVHNGNRKIKIKQAMLEIKTKIKNLINFKLFKDKQTDNGL